MGHLVMSDKERLRKAVFEMVKQGNLSLKIAAKQCHLSYRQTTRAYHRYLKEKDVGLVHKGRGRSSNRIHPQREIILTRYKERYSGFGPTLAAEKLAEEDNLLVDHDTLRLWLLHAGLWHKQRKRPLYRAYREPCAQFGELLQMDGSIHDWLEEGRHRCLMNAVDDATSKTLAHLESGETTAAVFRLLWAWVIRYGIPLALYVDLKTVYVSPKNTSFSHVEKACEKLGIRIIKAYSPQAKGRVERKHAIYQDRFIKELRLKNIKTEEKANEVLENGFIDKLNQKFEKSPRNPHSAHRPLHPIDLNQILCWEYQRQVQNDWTFSFKGQCYQIQKTAPLLVKPKQLITIRQHLDQSISLWIKNQKLAFYLTKKIAKSPAPKLLRDPFKIRHQARLNKSKSPWSQFNPNWLKIKKPVKSNLHEFIDLSQ